MINKEILRKKVSSINGRDYGAYQSLLGEYDFEFFKLIIQQVPKDPYAPPHTGLYRIIVPRKEVQVIDFQIESKTQKIAFCDFLARVFFAASEQVSGKIRGTGYSGIITINQPGQAILERNSVIVSEDEIEVRCFLGLPAQMRVINSVIAEKMIFEELPHIVSLSLQKKNIDQQEMLEHINTNEDAEYLRKQLAKNGLVAFISNDALLPRLSGTSDKPLAKEEAVLFKSPASLAASFNLPHAGKIEGMAIRKGITLIAGGGYHGKSTLLNVLEQSIYNHIPGDGRERCVSAYEAVKVRAYSGRAIIKTDISPFINNLPFKKDTKCFSTQNASGSTSQAASVIEAVEAGAKVLLMDEDTCAANFMIRDRKMQELVNKDDEPITAYIDRVQALYEELDISTILVLGGVGDYFEVAHTVIQMKNYQPLEVTKRAHEIISSSKTKRIKEGTRDQFTITERIPLPQSINPLNRGKLRIYAKEVHRLHLGLNQIDLTDVEQLNELSQTKAIAYALAYCKKHMDKRTSLKITAEKVIEDINEMGLDILFEKANGHFAAFRSIELICALNRLREFDIIQAKK